METLWTRGQHYHHRGRNNAHIFFTPIIILVNIAVYVAMCIDGVDLLTPGPEALLDWGGNFRPSTLTGEPWRLVTASFVHAGFLHLVLNMYGLLYIGMLLEPVLGKSRFLLAYLVSCVGAGIASMWWHPYTVSAGASGAIFGMFGLLLALLSSSRVEKKARRQLLVLLIAGLVVGYNLLAGTSDQVDHAAHLGGFLCGAMTGFAFIPGIKHPSSALARVASTTIVVLFVSSAAIAFYHKTPNDIPVYDRHVARMSELEHEAMGMYTVLKEESVDSALVFIRTKGLRNWNECLELSHLVERLELPGDLSARNAEFSKYFKLRKTYYELLYEAFNNNLSDYAGELISIDARIENQLCSLNQ